MQKGMLIIALAAFAFAAVPLSSILPQPLSAVFLAATTLAFPFLSLWLLQTEQRKKPN